MQREDDEADLEQTPRTKLGVAVLVVLFQLLIIFGLVRAFAPDFTSKAVESVLNTFNVTITAPPPPPPAKAPEKAGAAGDAGKKAVAREVKAEKPKVELAKAPAPKAASTGSANTSGAAPAGSGTGAGGSGSGPGAGRSGNGSGGGAVSKVQHISGQISNAKDFPIPPGGREERIGKSVILALTVAPSGRAVGCRIYKSSGLPDTDAVTCRLALDRLRFKPATNAAGEPVTATFYWQQKFFF